MPNYPTLRRRSAQVLIISTYLLAAIIFSSACRRNRGGAFVIALSDNVKTIDPIGSPSVDAASERVRSLMFNSLVKKDEKFDYVPELASNIQRSDDGLTFTFTLRDGVTFHDGRPFTSADAKYTLDTVLASTFAKAASSAEQAVDWAAAEPRAHRDHSEGQLRISEDPPARHWTLQVQKLRLVAAGRRYGGERELLRWRAAHPDPARARHQRLECVAG